MEDKINSSETIYYVYLIRYPSTLKRGKPFQGPGWGLGYLTVCSMIARQVPAPCEWVLNTQISYI